MDFGAATVAARLDRLTRRGVIASFAPTIDPVALGYAVTAFATLEIRQGRGQIVLALSNPDPEIEPALAREAGAKVAADGKSINNVLAFPGLFAGALRARATAFTDAMLLAASRTIAGAAPEGQLVPDALNGTIHEAVAAAVAAAATGKGKT